VPGPFIGVSSSRWVLEVSLTDPREVTTLTGDHPRLLWRCRTDRMI